MSLGDRIAQVAENQVGTTSGYRYLQGDGSEAWCDDFATWCLKQAGYTEAGHQAYVPSTETWAQNHGLWHAQGSGYTPHAGDMVTFDWNHDGTADHIGVVTGVNQDGTIRVVSGNSSGYGKTGGESAAAGAVSASNFSLNSSQIHGYIATSGGKGGGGNVLEANNAPGGAQGAQDTSPNMGAPLQQQLMQLLAMALGSSLSPADLTALENALGRGGLSPNQGNIDPNYTPYGQGATDYGNVTDPGQKGITEIARKVADENGIPENIFLAVIDHESSFNPQAVGDNGNSHGLGQVYSPAHPDFDVNRALHGNNGNADVVYQLQYSAHLLKSLYNKYHSWPLAVEHYNGSGPQAQQYSQTVMALSQKFTGNTANA